MNCSPILAIVHSPRLSLLCPKVCPNPRQTKSLFATLFRKRSRLGMPGMPSPARAILLPTARSLMSEANSSLGVRRSLTGTEHCLQGAVSRKYTQAGHCFSEVRLS